mmetsp:Transcript_96331/g.276592  ORF Transcript_96331/g.276592 Transcript_96331/m.276592 type:complete len:251 (+) Transcript_96331:942-1694(+)
MLDHPRLEAQLDVPAPPEVHEGRPEAGLAGRIRLQGAHPPHHRRLGVAGASFRLHPGQGRIHHAERAAHKARHALAHRRRPGHHAIHSWRRPRRSGHARHHRHEPAGRRARGARSAERRDAGRRHAGRRQREAVRRGQRQAVWVRQHAMPSPRGRHHRSSTLSSLHLRAHRTPQLVLLGRVVGGELCPAVLTRVRHVVATVVPASPLRVPKRSAGRSRWPSHGRLHVRSPPTHGGIDPPPRQLSAPMLPS